MTHAVKGRKWLNFEKHFPRNFQKVCFRWKISRNRPNRVLFEPMHISLFPRREGRVEPGVAIGILLALSSISQIFITFFTHPHPLSSTPIPWLAWMEKILKEERKVPPIRIPLYHFCLQCQNKRLNGNSREVGGGTLDTVRSLSCNTKNFWGVRGQWSERSRLVGVGFEWLMPSKDAND